MPTTYTDVQQTPGDGWWWAAHPVTGGKSQVVALDVDGDLVDTDHPVPATIVLVP